MSVWHWNDVSDIFRMRPHCIFIHDCSKKRVRYVQFAFVVRVRCTLSHNTTKYKMHVSLLLLVSLLFSESTVFVESTKHKPSNFRDALQVTKRLLAQIQSPDIYPRDRQVTATPTSASVCNGDGGVNFKDDGFNQFAFRAGFETTCNCTEGTSAVVFHGDFSNDSELNSKDTAAVFA
jgi:hypothetical protein